MVLKVEGDALVLLKDFIKYRKLDIEAMAGVMQYDYLGFPARLWALEKAVCAEDEE